MGSTTASAEDAKRKAEMRVDDRIVQLRPARELCEVESRARSGDRKESGREVTEKREEGRFSI